MEKINFQNLPSTETPINSTNLNQMQTNIENAINKLEEDSGWQRLTDTGESYAPIDYRKMGQLVVLSSRWYSETGISVNAWSNMILGTLPEGFRPTTNIQLAIYCKDLNSKVINNCHVRITPNGEVLLINSSDTKASSIASIVFNATYFI